MNIIKEQLLAIRSQVNAALAVIEQEENRLVPDIPNTICPHPSSDQTDVTTMGAEYRMFFCRACGSIVQTKEAVGT